MYNSIIVRYAEIALKGKNRAVFEKKLVRNINTGLESINLTANISRIRGRITLDTDAECKFLSRVFGISSYSRAIKIEPSKIKVAIDYLLKDRDFKSFRMSAKRIDKTHTKKSMNINIELGQYVVDKYKKKVSLKKCDVDIGIEFMQNKALVFVDSVEGPKGLPYGVNGQVFAIINNDQDRLAAWLMMKRGLRVRPIGNPGVLERYSIGYILKPEHQHNQRAPVVVGDTVDMLSDIDSVLIMRPLVGMTKQEISKRLKFINEKAKD